MSIEFVFSHPIELYLAHSFICLSQRSPPLAFDSTLVDMTAQAKNDNQDTLLLFSIPDDVFPMVDHDCVSLSRRVLYVM